MLPMLRIVLIIKGDFLDYDLWIRDIIKFPTLGDCEWEFWQYNNRGRVKGINMYFETIHIDEASFQLSNV